MAIRWEEALELELEAAYITREQEIFGLGFDIGKSHFLVADLERIKVEKYKEIRPYLNYTVKCLESEFKGKNPTKKMEGWPDYIIEEKGLNFVSKIRNANGEITSSVLKHGDKSVAGPFSRISIEDPTISSRKEIIKQLLAKGWKPRQFTKKGTPQMTVKGVPVDTLLKVGPFGIFLSEWYTAAHRQSQITGFITRYEERGDGRITPGCNPCGTNTTRAKHSGVANIPRVTSWYGKKMRCLFCVLDKALHMVGADLSGLELRCLAHRMKDPSYIDLVLNGDIHTYNMEMAGLDTRDQAKTFVYAFLYGGGDALIGRVVGGTAKDGKDLKRKFLESIPSLARLLSRVQKFSERGWLPGLDGRRIYVRSYEGRVLTHTALNTLLQSDGAIIAKKSMVLAHKEIRRLELPANQTIYYHDELQYEVVEGYQDQVGSILCQAMRDAGLFYNMLIPIDGEFKIGKNWADTH